MERIDQERKMKENKERREKEAEMERVDHERKIKENKERRDKEAELELEFILSQSSDLDFDTSVLKLWKDRFQSARN